MMIRVLGTIFAALLGLVFGSFLNVCATRWPKGKESVKAPLHCRACGRTLSWWERMPLLSWLASGGRCRTCHAWMGWRYPVVELGVASTWTIAAWQTLEAFQVPENPALDLLDATVFGLVKMALCWLLICTAVVDTEHLWLPDRLTLGGAAVGLFVSVTRFGAEWMFRALPLHWTMESGLADRSAHLFDATVRWLLAVLGVFLLILLIRWVYHALRRDESVDLGYVKLMLMLAAWLGLSRTMLAFVVGVVVAGVVALAKLVSPARGPEGKSGFDKLPFGACLSGGGIVAALWGGPIIEAYLRVCGF